MSSVMRQGADSAVVEAFGGGEAEFPKDPKLEGLALMLLKAAVVIGSASRSRGLVIFVVSLVGYCSFVKLRVVLCDVQYLEDGADIKLVD